MTGRWGVSVRLSRLIASPASAPVRSEVLEAKLAQGARKDHPSTEPDEHHGPDVQVEKRRYAHRYQYGSYSHPVTTLVDREPALGDVSPLRAAYSLLLPPASSLASPSPSDSPL